MKSPLDDAFNACLHALRKLGHRVEYKSRKRGVISASTSMSFLSWGETIELQLKALTDQKTKIEVKSSSSAQLIDWGKNEQNESAVIRELRKRLPE